MALRSSNVVAWTFVLLLAAAVGWLWYERGTTDLAVVGEASVKAAPDEYVFMPSYQETGSDETAVRSKVTTTGNNVVALLRTEGVTDAMMSSQVSVSQDYRYPYAVPSSDAATSSGAATSPAPGQSSGYVATYALTVTVGDVTLARKVLDVLKGTPVVGSITPISGFTDATQNALERQARKMALDDAKTQAQDTAETLGVAVRGIASIGQPTWGGPVPLAYDLNAAVGRDIAESAQPESPDLLVGEQEVSYTIQVVYRVR